MDPSFKVDLIVLESLENVDMKLEMIEVLYAKDRLLESDLAIDILCSL
jgi:hypothetical protein